MRDFEKISFEQFKKDIKDDKELYESYKLPNRESTAAAGYDLFLVENLTIAPNEIVKIPTGVKMRCENDEVLLIIVKSSTGFKYNIRLVNQVGVIDADYYNTKITKAIFLLKFKMREIKPSLLRLAKQWHRGSSSNTCLRKATMGRTPNEGRLINFAFSWVGVLE